MKKYIALLLALGICFPAHLKAADQNPPKLVVLLIVDGLPVRHLTDYADRFSENGFKFFMNQGAWLTKARYGFANTCTASGHATLITGAQPNRHGIISNIWFDRELGRKVYSVEDSAYHYPDEPMGKRRGASPKNLKIPTLGDALREQTKNKSRVFAISMKDRAAILMGGKTGTAYFYSGLTGRFITSTYYESAYPAWLTDYHQKKIQDRWFRKKWDLSREPAAYQGAVQSKRYSVDPGIGKKFPHPVKNDSKTPDAKYYAALSKTPFADEYLLDFFKTLLRNENLGKTQDAADLLAVSFSAHDSANHFFGPESVEALDHLLRLDRMIAELVEFLSGFIGLDHVLFVLTSDHGFADSPEHYKSKGFEAGRLDAWKTLGDLNRHLSKKFGAAHYAIEWSAPTLYLDHDLIAKKGQSSETVERESAAFLSAYPGIARVFTRSGLDNPYLIADGLHREVWRSWLFESRGDLYLIPKEHYYLMDEPHEFAANHATPYSYDTRVPLIFWGRWFQPGKFETPADMTDVVPTLSEILNIRPPEAAEGKVLREILK